MIGLGLGLNLSTSLGGLGAAQKIATPPEDWRAVATVATNTAQQSAFAAAQNAKSAKSRPSVTLASGEYIEYTVAAPHKDLLLVWRTATGAMTVTIDGGSNVYSPQFPAGGALVYEGSAREQIVMAPAKATGSTVIRVTSTAAGTTFNVVRLYEKPASGPFDCWLAFGPSREAKSLKGPEMENAIVATWPNRDTVVLNYCLSGADLTAQQPLLTDALALFAGKVSFVLLGSFAGNFILDNRPYQSGQKATIDNLAGNIIDGLKTLGTVFASNTSFRNYTSTAPTITLPDRTNGSQPYNEYVIEPLIRAKLPHTFNTQRLRPWTDEFANVLRYRSSLTDETHGNESQERANFRDTVFKRVYDGAWPADSAWDVLAMVVAAEATVPVTNVSTATAAYNEARYQVDALSDLAPVKAGLVSRVNAVGAAINAAGGSVDSFGGGTPTPSPTPTPTPTPTPSGHLIQVDFAFAGTNNTPAGWNRIEAGLADGTNWQTADLALLNDSGASTGVTLKTVARGEGGSASNGGSSTATEFPVNVGRSYHHANKAGTYTKGEYRLTGYAPDTSVVLKFFCSRVTSNRTTLITVVDKNGTQTGTINTNSNQSTLVTITAVADGSGEIYFSYEANSSGDQYGYINGLVADSR